MHNGRFIVLRIKKGEFATGRKSEEWKDRSYSGTFYNNTSEQLIKAALYSLFLFESCTFSVSVHCYEGNGRTQCVNKEAFYRQ